VGTVGENEEEEEQGITLETKEKKEKITKSNYKCLRSMGIVGGRNAWEVSTGTGKAKIKNIVTIGDLLNMPPVQKDAILNVIADQEAKWWNECKRLSEGSPYRDVGKKSKPKSENSKASKKQKAQFEQTSDNESTDKSSGGKKATPAWPEETTTRRKKTSTKATTDTQANGNGDAQPSNNNNTTRTEQQNTDITASLSPTTS